MVEIESPSHSFISKVDTAKLLSRLQISSSDSFKHVPEAVEVKSVWNVVSSPSFSTYIYGNLIMG